MPIAQKERCASRTQLRSLGTLVGKYRARGVTLTRLSDRVGRSVSYLSEITRGLLPDGRRVTMDEFARIRAAIEALGKEGR